ncbi:MAG: CDP-alcohol phosphatidyltransferase family protein [Candidatus Helarchaeota archaeon]
MPSRYRLKNLFKGKLVKAITKVFIKLRFTPNMVSIFGFLNILLAVLLFVFLPFPVNSIIFGVLIFWIMLLDGVDGTLARMTNQVTFFGGFFDSVIDRYSDSILIMGFFFANIPIFFILLPLHVWIILGILGFVMVSYTRARAEIENIGSLDVGVGARTERLFILFIFSILMVPNLGLMLSVIISHLTVFYRIIYFKRLIDKNS